MSLCGATLPPPTRSLSLSQPSGGRPLLMSKELGLRSPCRALSPGPGQCAPLRPKVASSISGSWPMSVRHCRLPGLGPGWTGVACPEPEHTVGGLSRFWLVLLCSG